MVNADSREIKTAFADAFPSDFPAYNADWDDEWIDDAEIVFTRDTIEQFIANRKTSFNEPGRVVEQTPTSLKIEALQRVKGEQRQDVWVVDLGEWRAVASMDTGGKW